MDSMKLKISGMSCGHCVGAVTRALKGLPGVQVDEVSIGSATVSYDAAATSAERIAQAVEDEGYPVVETAPR